LGINPAKTTTTENKNKNKTMNAKTLEAITRHGESLLKAFPNATEKNPVALCKKLRRIENSIALIILRNCNEGVPDDEMDAATDKAKMRVAKLLGITPATKDHCGEGWHALQINRDPRGYALKLSSEWTDKFNDTLRGSGLFIHQDWGHYGILAPDLNAK
jgi:hypothetical protein